VPRSGAHGGDPPGADGLTAMLVLGVSEAARTTRCLAVTISSTLTPRVDARNRAGLLWSAGPATSAEASHRFDRRAALDGLRNAYVYIRMIIEH
jgi:hypothetical protein